MGEYVVAGLLTESPRNLGFRGLSSLERLGPPNSYRATAKCLFSNGIGACAWCEMSGRWREQSSPGVLVLCRDHKIRDSSRSAAGLIHPPLRLRRIRGREDHYADLSVTHRPGVMMNRRPPGDPVGIEIHLRRSFPVGRKEPNGQMSCSELSSNAIVRVVHMKIQTILNF